MMIKAAVVYSCIWALGGCLETEDDRAIFDTSMVNFLLLKLNYTLHPLRYSGNYIW